MVCSRQRSPLYMKSMNSFLVSCLVRTLAMTNTSVGHWDGQRVSGHRQHVLLNHFPDVKDFASTKRTDVMLAFQQHTVFQVLANGAGVVFDPLGKLFGCQVRVIHANILSTD